MFFKNIIYKKIYIQKIINKYKGPRNVSIEIENKDQLQLIYIIKKLKWKDRSDPQKQDQ